MASGCKRRLISTLRPEAVTLGWVLRSPRLAAAGRSRRRSEYGSAAAERIRGSVLFCHQSRPGQSPVEVEFDLGACMRNSDNGRYLAGDLPGSFQRFYRSESARLAGAPGSGLSLAIARWIDSHQAKIAVESIPERGTTFRISFSTFTFLKISPLDDPASRLHFTIGAS